MSRRSKIVIGITLLLAILFGVVVFTLLSPTDAPPKYSLDYLRIVSSLYEIENRVEIQKGKVAIDSDVNGRKFIELSEDEKRGILEKSGGLVRQVNLGSDGTISVRATIAAKPESKGAQFVEVDLVFVPEKVGNGKFEWRCFGDPITSLPVSCRALNTKK